MLFMVPGGWDHKLRKLAIRRRDGFSGPPLASSVRPDAANPPKSKKNVSEILRIIIALLCYYPREGFETAPVATLKVKT
jgi:hypothetical protein